MALELKAFIEQCQRRVNNTLERALSNTSARHPKAPPSNTLLSAMRYSLLSGGKRFRPCLVYAAALAANNKSNATIQDLGDATDKTASALEMIHAYSLIHDDLPAMDNDDLRRGKATCHIAFDEATAILAGDALQSLAFEHLTQINSLEPEKLVELVAILARAAGPTGMVLGQAIDVSATGEALNQDQLQTMHQRKTGDLIVASVLMGAHSVACTNEATLAALASYGEHLGLAFQIRDDLLDAEGSTRTLGKHAGADQRLTKATYTSILGCDGAKHALEQAHQQSLSAINQLGSKANLLRGIAGHTVDRKF